MQASLLTSSKLWIRPFQDLQLSSSLVLTCQVMRLPGLLPWDGSGECISLSGSFSCCSASIFLLSDVILAFLVSTCFLCSLLPLSRLMLFPLHCLGSSGPFFFFNPFPSLPCSWDLGTHLGEQGGVGTPTTACSGD